MSNKRIPKKSENKVGVYNLVEGPFPYHAREDQTTLPSNTLVSPSQNVINNTANRLQLVKGYTLDGGASTTIDSGIQSNYDFYPTRTQDVRNMRAGFLTSAGSDGKLQFRYVNAAGTVSWIDLKTGLTTINMCFDGNYWDTTELLKLLLWVDGSNFIYEWNGAVTTFASATATTLTKQGTDTWAQTGFYQAKSGRSITIGGVTATYSGGEGTTTLTGVSVDFSATTVGAEIHQTPVSTALSSMTSILSTFGPTVIGCGRQNQLYVGASTSNSLYISKVNNYKDYSFTSPVRVAGEGFLLSMDAPPVKFIPQEVHGDEQSYDMWISTGLSNWSIIRSTLSADNADEAIQFIRLKSAPLQGTMSERLCSKMKNQIIFIGNDNVCNAMGYYSYQYVPVMQDLSYPIIDDMNSYDFTDGSIFYHKNFIYVAVPKYGLIRIYNMTNQTEETYSNYNPQESLDPKQPFYWEAPIGYPISGFYVVDGDLYGHGYNTSESYKLFNGGSFNGQDINANATLAFDTKGDRTQSKGSNEIWVEGYIKQNTVLNTFINEDLDAFQVQQTVTINGNDNSIVAYGGGGNSLGDTPLGVQPLGGSQDISSALPAWFHVIKTYTQNSYYLEQIAFQTKGVDLQWELVTWGTNATFTTEGNNAITQ